MADLYYFSDNATEFDYSIHVIAESPEAAFELFHNHWEGETEDQFGPLQPGDAPKSEQLRVYQVKFDPTYFGVLHWGEHHVPCVAWAEAR